MVITVMDQLVYNDYSMIGQPVYDNYNMIDCLDNNDFGGIGFMKKEEKTELTKEKIINAAILEFGTKGYDGSSLNNISNTGISKGLIYHNFKNKDEVYLACVERCFSSLKTYLQGQAADIDLQQYMDLRFHFFSENELYARIFFEAVLQPPKKLSERIKELKKDFDGLNMQIYCSTLSTVKLRDGVKESEALQYFEIVQKMFNGYFSSPAYSDTTFTNVIADHEIMLSKLLDYMLYGIAERRKKI